jgi:hypothetical protein
MKVAYDILFSGSRERSLRLDAHDRGERPVGYWSSVFLSVSLFSRAMFCAGAAPPKGENVMVIGGTRRSY